MYGIHNFSELFLNAQSQHYVCLHTKVCKTKTAKKALSHENNLQKR